MMSKPRQLFFARLIDWIEDRLSEEEAAAVAAQVAAADEATQAEVASLRSFLRASANTVLVAPPQKVRDLLIQRFEAYAQSRCQPGFLERVVAALSYDSHWQQATAGLRTAGAQAAPRQLIYTTGVADIALNIQPSSRYKHFDLSGQVLPNQGTAIGTYSVQLLRGATEAGLTLSDDPGEFVFEAIPAGVYELILSSDQVEILIASIELTA